jgi:transcription factor STE12
MPAPQPMAAPQYPSMMRPLHHYASALEGSPTYKQRRRRSSLTQGSTTPQNVTSHAVHRPSDLRHSSVPVHHMDTVYHDSPRGVTPNHQKDYSRHATPVDDMPSSSMPMGQDEYAQAYPQDQYRPVNYAQAAVMRTPNGVFRRARSATVQDMNTGSPYPSKSHSCPIPMCGRLFKRLEHLKR